MDFGISKFDKLMRGISLVTDFNLLKWFYGFHSYYIMNKVFITEKGSDLRNELITE